MSEGRDFWARRRAGVEAEAKAEKQLAAEAEMAKLEERPDAELLAEANLPDPDTLETVDAVQTFLRSELPERLKTRALRRLWRMNPVLANLDGLVDYGEDYTDAATVVDNLQSVYQVGKGMLTAFVEDDTEEAEEDLVAASEPDEEAPEEIEAAQVEAQAMTVAEPVNETMKDPEPELIAIAQPERRMRFEFSDA